MFDSGYVAESERTMLLENVIWLVLVSVFTGLFWGKYQYSRNRDRDNRQAWYKGYEKGLEKGKDRYIAQLELEEKKALEEAFTPAKLKDEAFAKYPFFGLAICINQVKTTEPILTLIKRDILIKGGDVSIGEDESQWIIHGTVHVPFVADYHCSSIELYTNGKLLWTKDHQTHNYNPTVHAEFVIKTLIEAITHQNKLAHTAQITTNQEN
jgi:hypothetical protein